MVFDKTKCPICGRKKKWINESWTCWPCWWWSLDCHDYTKILPEGSMIKRWRFNLEYYNSK